MPQPYVCVCNTFWRAARTLRHILRILSVPDWLLANRLHTHTHTLAHPNLTALSIENHFVDLSGERLAGTARQMN